ncbi:hypothetical protein Ciccas_010403 [Cichlidogyrus casuarinus]|uniref:Uncharacterized protein n=1 Tax=Cichlidogyrus casuarinus TaxID=1844966 RepID=A0ABD2PW80_9PLAT
MSNDIDSVHRGNSRNTWITLTVAILLFEFMERLSFQSINANIYLYMTTILGHSVSKTMVIQQLLGVASYFTPIIGGLMADKLMGRYPMLVVFTLMMLMSCIFITLSNHNDLTSHSRSGLFYAGIFILAISCGLMKACTCIFGADQASHVSAKAGMTFLTAYVCIVFYPASFTFSFYLTFNASSLIAISVLGHVGQHIDFRIVFLCTVCSSSICLLALVLPAKQYDKAICSTRKLPHNPHTHTCSSDYNERLSQLLFAYLQANKKGPESSVRIQPAVTENQCSAEVMLRCKN